MPDLCAFSLRLRRVGELLSYDQTSISAKNPRFGYVVTKDSVVPLVAELKAVGQAHDAIGERGPYGMVEILAGSRRPEACRILDTSLRVRSYDSGSLTTEHALKIANREDRSALEVGLWDRSAISRGLPLQKAPTAERSSLPNCARTTAAFAKAMRGASLARSGHTDHHHDHRPHQAAGNRCQRRSRFEDTNGCALLIGSGAPQGTNLGTQNIGESRLHAKRSAGRDVHVIAWSFVFQ